MEQQQQLEELRKKRRLMVNIMHEEIPETTILEHIRVILIILRNLSFIKSNEHQIVKCSRIIDIVVSLFTDYSDREITINSLDIITNIAKNLSLRELTLGRELVATLFYSLHQSLKDSEGLLEDCIECLRRLSLMTGNEEILEEIRDEDIEMLV